MEKLREGTPAITVGGEPLEDHLEKQEEKEKRNDLEEARKEEIGTKTKHKKKFRPRERFEDDPARVSKRVRRMSDYEIRKEYGVREKPFPTLHQNVLFTLYNSGKTLINSKAISDEVGKSLADVSSALSHIWKKLRNEGLIYRERKGLAYHYRLRERALAHGFEGLYRKYWKSTPAKSRQIITYPGERTGPYAHGDLLYKRTSKNVIDLISRSMGEEFLAREIAAGVGKPPANISSTLQMVIKRLEPHGMIDLLGGRSSRSYKLHPGLSNVLGADLIEFVQSHKKWYEKSREKAWEFFNERLPQPTPPPEPEPEPVEVEDPRLAGAYKHLMELTTSMFERIESLEQDGLGEQVENLHKIHQGIRREFEQFKTGVSSDIKDIFDLENKAPGKFDLNINVRFLLH